MTPSQSGRKTVYNEGFVVHLFASILGVVVLFASAVVSAKLNIDYIDVLLFMAVIVIGSICLLVKIVEIAIERVDP